MAHTQAAYTSLVVREVGSSSGTQGRPVEVAVVAEVRLETSSAHTGSMSSGTPMREVR